MKAGNNVGDKYRLVAEINMIPMIDVALVLVIIFMVITPFLLQAQIKVNLPKSVTSVTPDETPLEIQIMKNGAVFTKGKQIPVEALESTLMQLLANPGQRTVLIQADKDVAFEKVVSVMDVVKRIGVEKLGVAIKPARQ